jgi:hypothetical protein
LNAERLTRNSEAVAWLRHAEVQNHQPVDSDYESDDDSLTPQEKIRVAIVNSGIASNPSATFDETLPKLNPYESDYFTDAPLFSTRTLRSKPRQHWLIDRSQEWMQSLDEAELAAVMKWTVNGHDVIGEYLEYGKVRAGESAEGIREYQKTLARALEKNGAVLDEPIRVYRGIDSERFIEDANPSDYATAAMMARYIERAYANRPISNDDMPRSATLSSGIAATTFTSGYYDVVLDFEVDEIHSPVNFGAHSVNEEEVLLVGNIMVSSAEVVDGVILVHCYLD